MGKAKLVATLVFLGLTGLYGVCAPEKPPASSQGEAKATEGWQKEFDDICSKTQDAMTFTAEQLTALVQRCDALEPQIEKLDETRKKVYLKRLRQCRGLFNYVLESKKKDNK